jgi:NADH-quinone oxidoreductase subunit M
MLWMFKRVFFGEKGPLVSDVHHPLHDLSAREIVVMVPLIFLVFWMGLFPNQILDVSKSSIENLVKNRTKYSLEVQFSRQGGQ